MLQYLERLSGDPPQRVYHYTTQAAFYSIVQSKALWASNALYLNDSSEMRYGIDVLNDVVGDRSAEFELHDGGGFISLWNEVTAAPLTGSVYVAAFSGVRDDLSQWRAYGGDFGYCLAFDTATVDLVRHREGFLGFFLRCLYSEHEQRAAASEMFKLIESQIAQMSTERIRAVFRDLLIMTAACIKHPSYQAEAEWRLIIVSPDRSSVKHGFRTGKSFLIPYIELPLVPKGADPHLPEVVIGPTPHPALAGPAAWNACTLNGWQIDKVSVTEIPYRAW